MRSVQVAALLLLSAPLILAQGQSQNTAAFRASVIAFQSNSVQWQNDLARIKVEELSISYAEGHVIEQDKEVAIQNLDLMSKLTARVLKTGRLSDEINLLETSHEMSSQMQEIVHVLLDANVKDDAAAKKIMDWSTPLSDLANGAVNTFYLNTFKYVTAHADQIESQHCAHAK